MNRLTLSAALPVGHPALARPALRGLRLLLAGGAAGVLIASLWHPAVRDLPAALLLGAMLLAGEWLAVRRHGSAGVLSISFAILAAALFVAGPQTAVPLGAASVAIGDGLLRRRPLSQVVEQASLLVLMLAGGAWLAGIPVAGATAPSWAPPLVMLFWAPAFGWILVRQLVSAHPVPRTVALSAAPIGVIVLLSTLDIWWAIVPSGVLQDARAMVAPALLLAAGFMLVDTMATSWGQLLAGGLRGLEVWHRVLVPTYYRYTGQAVAAAALIGAYKAADVQGLAIAGLVALLAVAIYGRHVQQRELLVAGLCTLAAALDAKDPYTQGHSDRVARYSVAVARKLGLGARATRTIQLAAQLHDIGKIGIADAVLLKPGKLTAEEFETMKGHVEKGVEILRNLPQLNEAAALVEQEHERWDGSGYPKGLTGDQIALGARIIAVADVYDALTSDRPYRRGVTPEAALVTLDDLAGLELDPEPVRALRTLQEHDGLDPELDFGYCLSH